MTSEICISACTACRMRVRFELSVMQLHLRLRLVRILIDVVDPLRVEQRGPALDAMNLAALFEKELGEAGPVLPGDTGVERVRS